MADTAKHLSQVRLTRSLLPGELLRSDQRTKSYEREEKKAVFRCSTLCVWVHTCAWSWVCMCACTYAWSWVCMCTWSWVCVYVYVHMCKVVSLHVCAHGLSHECACMCVHICMVMNVHVCARVHGHECTCVCTWACLWVCMLQHIVCMWVCGFTPALHMQSPKKVIRCLPLPLVSLFPWDRVPHWTRS